MFNTVAEYSGYAGQGHRTIGTYKHTVGHTRVHTAVACMRACIRTCAHGAACGQTHSYGDSVLALVKHFPCTNVCVCLCVCVFVGVCVCLCWCARLSVNVCVFSVCGGMCLVCACAPKECGPLHECSHLDAGMTVLTCVFHCFCAGVIVSEFIDV